MRDIIFRGKSLNDGVWIEGNLLVNTYEKAGKTEKEYIIVDYIYGEDEYGFGTFQSGCEEVVDSATVGQFTGLTDKNGKRIFEGDIVKKRVYNGVKPREVCFSFGSFHCGFGGGSSTATHPYLLDDANIEVIGNIYDNPELLGENK